MVGVAGRSRACGNCRKRHIRCDETKPICKRCIKSKLDCDGYRDLTVIHYTAAGKGSGSLASSSVSTHELPSKDGSLQFMPFTWSTPWLSIVPDSDDVFMNYTFAHLLKGHESIDPTAELVDRELADRCFLALATTYFGYGHKENRIITRGLTRYGTVLQELHDALANANRCNSYDVLESILLMCLFEFLMTNNKDGWVAHALGLQRLFEIRGPESFQRMPDRGVFQASRPGIIFACLVLQQPTILSQPRWKTVPWARDPDQKLLMQHLLDILADCPSLVSEKAKRFGVNGSQSPVHDLHEQINAHLTQLRTWKDLWDLTEPDYYSETTAPTSTPMCTAETGKMTKAWGTVLYFSTIYHANTTALYHAIHILLLRMLYTSDGTEAEFNISPEEYAAGIEICRSVDYHLQKMREGEGSFYILFPLRMAWQSLSKVQPAIGTWLENALKKIETGEAGRWALAGYILSITKSS